MKEQENKPVRRLMITALYAVTYLGTAGIIASLFNSDSFFDLSYWQTFILTLGLIPIGMSCLFGFGDDAPLLGHSILVALVIWGVVSKRRLAYLLFLLALAMCIGGCILGSG